MLDITGPIIIAFSVETGVITFRKERGRANSVIWGSFQKEYGPKLPLLLNRGVHLFLKVGVKGPWGVGKGGCAVLEGHF